MLKIRIFMETSKAIRNYPKYKVETLFTQSSDSLKSRPLIVLIKRLFRISILFYNLTGTPRNKLALILETAWCCLQHGSTGCSVCMTLAWVVLSSTQLHFISTIKSDNQVFVRLQSFKQFYTILCTECRREKIR